MENLIELANIIDDLYARYERAKDHKTKAAIRKEYAESAARYNKQAGKKIYPENL